MQTIGFYFWLKPSITNSPYSQVFSHLRILKDPTHAGSFVLALFIFLHWVILQELFPF